MGKGETGYIASNIQQEQHGFSLLGGGKISEALLFTSDQNNGTWSLSQESCTTYIIHSIFLWFGIIVEAGDSVVVIEHNLDVIKTADYLIDLGPEGGDKGGTLVACGTPEELAKVKKSYTGQYVKQVLKQAKDNGWYQ